MRAVPSGVNGGIKIPGLGFVLIPPTWQPFPHGEALETAVFCVREFMSLNSLFVCSKLRMGLLITARQV